MKEENMTATPITIRITPGQYKETQYVTVSITAQDETVGLRFSFNKSFDVVEPDNVPPAALDYIASWTHSLLSTRTPTREGTSEGRCRCDGADMQGSDHCPRCGCEEYEEREDCPCRIGGAASRAARFAATGDTEILTEGLDRPCLEGLPPHCDCNPCCYCPETHL